MRNTGSSLRQTLIRTGISRSLRCRVDPTDGDSAGHLVNERQSGQSVIAAPLRLAALRFRPDTFSGIVRTMDHVAGSEIFDKSETHARHARLERLAARYVWWTEPKRTVDENLPRLVAAMMEMATWEDAVGLEHLVGAEAISNVLDHPPPGIVSAKSLAYWHARLGRQGEPPSPRARFGDVAP
jgi:hypothetical protein